MSLGYIPTGRGVGDEVAATLNYALADYSMSLAALSLGDSANATLLRGRARHAWRALFHPTLALFAPRHEDGSWDVDSFDKFAWEGAGGEYTEAAPWQYRFYVPHEPSQLRDAYAAANVSMCETLEAMMTGGVGREAPGSIFHNGHWGLHHEQAAASSNPLSFLQPTTSPSPPPWHHGPRDHCRTPPTPHGNNNSSGG